MKKTVLLFLALGGLTAWADITFDPAQFDNLQGKVHRGDLGRSGVFNASGVSSVKGVKWKFQTGGAIKSSPVVVNGVAYFGSHDGAVYAVNVASGARIWSSQTGGKVSGSAAVVSNTVFIVSENGKLYAFNATTGATNWSVLIESGKVSAGSPAVAYGVVFIGAGSQYGYRAMSMSAGYIYGYSMTNGAQVWKSKSSGPQGYAAIALDSTNLYAGLGGSTYAAFKLTNGASQWSKDEGSQNRQFTSMSVVNGSVFFPGTIRGSVSRYTPGGTQKWLTTTLEHNDDEGNFEMNTGGIFGYETLTDVAVANDRVYAGCNDGKLYTFAQTNGAKGWTFQTGGKVQSSPSVASNIVYFGSWDGKVYAVNATNGSEVWNYNLGARIISSPWPADGALYVGCDDGALYCLEEGFQTYTLTTTVNNTNWGSAAPTGGVYQAGSNVQISATASNYYHFVSWTGALTSVSNPDVVTMNTDKVVSAVFAANLLTNNVPAWWLAQYNLATNDAGALSDTDIDGLAAWQEYIAGTVPTNAGSVFNMTGLSVPGSTIVSWSTAPGRVYSVFWTSNLLNGFTTVLGTNIPWTGNIFTDSTHSAEQQGFYRIDVKWNP